MFPDIYEETPKHYCMRLLEFSNHMQRLFYLCDLTVTRCGRLVVKCQDRSYINIMKENQTCNLHAKFV